MAEQAHRASYEESLLEHLLAARRTAERQKAAIERDAQQKLRELTEGEFSDFDHSVVTTLFELLPAIDTYITKRVFGEDPPVVLARSSHSVEGFAGALSIAARASQVDIVGSYERIPITATPEAEQTELVAAFHRDWQASIVPRSAA